jgi:hypothetical protein
MFAETIDKFIESGKSALVLMEECQKLFAPKKDVIGPKFEEAAQKVKAALVDFDLVAMNAFLRENVVQQLTKLQTTAFEGFVGQTDTAYAERLATTKALIEPYRKLAEALAPVCSLQSTMLAQAQLKKIPMRYDDLKTWIAKQKQIVAELKATLDQIVELAIGKNTPRIAEG